MANNRTRPMVALPGGEFLMGTDYERAFAADGEGPVRPVRLSPFRIDTFPVTNKDFAAFVDAAGYRTEAELFAWSFVFWMHLPPDRLDELVEDTVAAAPWWCKVPGADWRHPEGPGSHVEGRENYPVVHVSWNDAAAYAAWAGKSLPAEAQWEYAARGGLEQKLYPWGDDLTPGDPATGKPRYLCNIWQGEFPRVDTAEDGFAGACAVDAFPPNGYGLYSMTGNVWEWCADWFGTAFSRDLQLDPPGPDAGETKVMKGGSFLCHASYCNRYRVAARTSNTPDSAASNIGFRCVDKTFQ
jgi:sulfatase modifying factor 1